MLTRTAFSKQPRMKAVLLHERFHMLEGIVFWFYRNLKGGWFILASFGIRFCCFEFELRYSRSCSSHSIANTCWSIFQVRSRLVHILDRWICYVQRFISLIKKQRHKTVPQYNSPFYVNQFIAFMHSQARFGDMHDNAVLLTSSFETVSYFIHKNFWQNG